MLHNSCGRRRTIDRTGHIVRYDGAYYSIDYPGGDVPADIGVCTDVLIRSYRKAGVDLQKEIHEDIVANFDSYPSKKTWGLSKPDTNIDHRRVPNLQFFFKWKGHRSSRLGDQYRVIYLTEEQHVVVKVVDLTAHDYRRKSK